MRFDLTIYADSSDELQAALSSIANTLPPTTFAQRQGFRIEVTPTYLGDVPTQQRPVPFDAEAQAQAHAEDAAQSLPVAQDVPTVLPQPPPAQAPAPARVRPSRAKGAQVEPPTPTPAPEPEAATPEPEPTLSPGEPTLSPGEAKLKALEVLRTAYGLPGGAKAIKDVQSEFGCSKFVEVPDDQGLALYARAKALLASLNGAGG